MVHPLGQVGMRGEQGAGGPEPITQRPVAAALLALAAGLLAWSAAAWLRRRDWRTKLAEAEAVKPPD